MISALSTPQIFVTGRIISATGFEATELFIKWEVIIGTNFKVVDGIVKGETFQSVTQSHENVIHFDHPLYFSLSCRSIKGWPKILVEVWATDHHNKNFLVGYGSVFIPFRVGYNKQSIKCWRPVEKGYVTLSETFLGNTPEFVNKSAVYSTDEKFGLNGLSTGEVEVELEVIMKDFNLHGIKLNKN